MNQVGPLVKTKNPWKKFKNAMFYIENLNTSIKRTMPIEDGEDDGGSGVTGGSFD